MSSVVARGAAESEFAGDGVAGQFVVGDVVVLEKFSASAVDAVLVALLLLHSCRPDSIGFGFRTRPHDPSREQCDECGGHVWRKSEGEEHHSIGLGSPLHRPLRTVGFTPYSFASAWRIVSVELARPSMIQGYDNEAPIPAPGPKKLRKTCLNHASRVAQSARCQQEAHT